MASAPPEIFVRARRRARRDRAAARFADHAFLVDAIGDELLDRLDDVTRHFDHALDLGCHDGRLGERLKLRGMRVTSADAGFRFASAAGGVQCDEDRLPFADASFDLVVSAGVLDQVSDIPGALALIRRVLKPDGLFLAGFLGAGSLPVLRDTMMAADMAADRGVGPRLHPQIDVRAAGDLLHRAGFALPVADSRPLAVRYGDPLRLIHDLRGMAATNLLVDGGRAPLTRIGLAAAAARFAEGADLDGRRAETFELMVMTGWAPDPASASRPPPSEPRRIF
ncbi:MAG TPA: methyltransferase domain-containing protein [Sphingomonas sp.]|jgi:SAM-dependent methyltransferase|uniref:methyltransferase domain-containing protein n=1 Tax=Sphingomonas sp. TaxID=28214 RepID=UPI002ED9FFB9